jgi:hypothetical protein
MARALYSFTVSYCCGVVQGQANSQGLAWAWRDASCMRTQAVSFLDSSSSLSLVS